MSPRHENPMNDRADFDLHQAILQAIRDQGERQIGALESLTTEIRDLAKSILKNQGAAPVVKNGGWQPYAIILTLFAAIMAPTWGTIQDIRDDVQSLRNLASDQRVAYTEDYNAATHRLTHLEGDLRQIETQFSASGDIANLERQYAMTVADLLHQCPTCAMPSRDYWPLANVGGNSSSDKQ